MRLRWSAEELALREAARALFQSLLPGGAWLNDDWGAARQLRQALAEQGFLAVRDAAGWTGAALLAEECGRAAAATTLIEAPLAAEEALRELGCYGDAVEGGLWVTLARPGGGPARLSSLCDRVLGVVPGAGWQLSALAGEAVQLMSGEPAAPAQPTAVSLPRPVAARVRLLLAAEALGGARRCLELAVERAREREQFGRPIGGFQAVQHRLANGRIREAQVELLVYRAAWALDQGGGAAEETAAAKLAACDHYCQVSAAALMVHGGSGFLRETPVQGYYRRAPLLRFDLGSPSELAEELAAGQGF